MFKAWLRLSFLSLCVIAGSSYARTDVHPEKIYWLLNDAPPFFILSGKHQNQGICDVTLAYIKRALPDIEHEDLVMPHTRLSKFMDDGAKACFPCMIKRPQPTSRATYSIPTVVYPPHVLVTTLDFIARHNIKPQMPVSFETLLLHKNVVFAKHSGRKFGEVLDVILTSHIDKIEVVTLHNEGRSTTSVLDLLRLKRADFSIEYPAIVNYYNASQQQELHSLELLENRHKPVAGAIGCATSAPDRFALKATSAVNKVLPNIVNDKEYQKQVSQWFSAGETYWDWYQTLVLAR